MLLPRRLSAVLVLLSLPLCACQGVRTLTDPTLTMRTSGGSELGVSTDYGIVFLGRTADSGAVEITAWFGDGPSIEKSVIEPIGGGLLYTAETEIVLPRIPMSFADPKPGAELFVVGRNGADVWVESVTVQEDPRVMGIITTMPARLRNAPEQVGAGVYVVPEGDWRNRRLLGLVSGRIRMQDGGPEYLTVVGPTDLWRLVSHRREPRNKKRFVYREDIL